MTRTHTYSWEHPQLFVDAADGLTGLEVLNRIGAGELPLVPRRRHDQHPPRRSGEGRAEGVLGDDAPEATMTLALSADTANRF
jgi:hypothetical protein